jgi:hypothetical protein
MLSLVAWHKCIMVVLPSDFQEALLEDGTRKHVLMHSDAQLPPQ